MGSMKFLVAALLAIVGLGALAQRPHPPGPPAVQQGTGDSIAVPTPDAGGPRLEAADLNAWLDGFMPLALANGDIAGATVVVVRDGQLLSQRGYGYADVARRIPVDPARTLFRTGSISKLFTWTAVMQLVEQGRLDLDADVNLYLDFEIPAYRDQPVTLRHIMTHTAGFEEQVKSIFGFDPAEVPSNEQILKSWIPHRVYAPGTTPAYSNYATALAGYIVERVSGEPFADYVQRNILTPLQMNHSTFAQPLPPRLGALMSTGYYSASGEPVPFEIVGPVPAGALSATGADMARFMIANLNDGAIGGSRILRPETSRLMHETRAAHGIGPLNRMLLGYYEQNINGQRVSSHGGDTVAFHSQLYLFRDADVGLFIAFNSAGRGGASIVMRNALFEQFADRYFPAPRDRRRVDPQIAASHARMMAGNWVNSRGSHSNFLNVTELLGQLRADVGAEGELILPFAFGEGGPPRRWVEVTPFVWEDQNSHERLAAQVEDGRIVRFSMSSISPFMVFDRAPWHRSSAVLIPALLASIVILLLTALSWPVRALIRRKYGVTPMLERRELRSYRWVRIAAWAILATLAGWVATIMAMMVNLENLSQDFDPIIWSMQILTFLTFLGGLGIMAVDGWLVWTGKRGWKAKAWSVALLFAVLVIVWIGVSFNLLSLGTDY